MSTAVTLDAAHFALRLATATTLGAIIGLERQLSRHLAGLQTNTLVAAGAAMFILLSEATMGPNDSRIAGQIVTGIGFLGSGVIMRDGLQVRGLNTAATLWCAAAIGTLCGSGQLMEAVLCAATVLGINLVLRPLAIRIAPRGDAMQADYRYRFTAVVDKNSETIIRAELLHLLNLGKLSLRCVETEVCGDGIIRMDAEIFANEKMDSTLAQIAGGFATREGVSSLRWEHLK